jgi:short-subunit dehydrogenase
VSAPLRQSWSEDGLPEDRTVLITGASGGIGSELAKLFCAEGLETVLVARNGPKLEQLARELERRHDVRSTPLPIDLCAPGAPERLFAEVKGRGMSVDILVNNAALMEFGAFQDAEHEALLDMTRLNVGATTALTHLFLPGMIERGSGRIMNVGSVGAFMPMPSMAVYAATKAFLLSFSEALSEELEGTGVSVTAFCAGFTRTHMLDKIEGVESWMERLPPGVVMEPAWMAEHAYAACMARDTVRVPGAMNKLTMMLLGLTPRWVLRKLGGVIGRRVM